MSKKSDHQEHQQEQKGEANKWEEFAKNNPESDVDPQEKEVIDEMAGIGYPSHEELDQKLTSVEMERDALQEKFVRTQAELENIRRRAERDIGNAHKYGNEKLLSDLLPVVDSIVRGLEGRPPEDALGKGLYEGMQLTLSMLEKTLQKHGVTIIDPEEGTPFNPERHEAMSMQQVPGEKPNTILKVLQKGYELNGRVIRAAMVIVSQ